jgi:hypothetical protein
VQSAPEICATSARLLESATVHTSSSNRRAARHLAAAGAFVLVAILWTFPLVGHLSTHLPGSAAGDNVTFLWNFWWMRAALGSSAPFFHTTHLFAPVGTDLTLHTHTALPAFAGATLFGSLPVITALNVTILASVFLNGFCAYLLGWRITRDHGAGIVAGLVFAGSPFIAAHLHGHFNLTTAWTIPLFALAVSEAITRGSARWGVAAGLLLGATAYIDYYFVVYETVLAACLFAFEARAWSVGRAEITARSRRWARIVGVVLLLEATTIAVIAITGGFTIGLGAARLSMRSLFNPLQAFWILLAAWLWLRFRPRIHAGPNPGFHAGGAVWAVLLLAAVFVLIAAPLLWNGAALMARGEYVSQRYFWRSAPKGIDLATLVLGNPFQGLWGGPIQDLYRAMGIDALESSGWLGIAPLGLMVWAIARGWREPAVGRWSAIGAVFFVWALGPHLMAFGHNTGLILPQALFRYVPILSNARVPGRSLVLVFLALALLTAWALAEWRRRSRHPTLVLGAAALAIAIDFLPAPFPLTALPPAAIYDTLRDRPERGALCELPMGLRDGLGSRGALDDRVLFYQTVHGRPLTGGFVARLSPAIIAAYEADPLLSSLLRLSGDPNATVDAVLPDRRLAGTLLQKNGIAFVMLNRATAPPVLIDYVEHTMPLTLIAQENERALFLVDR